MLLSSSDERKTTEAAAHRQTLRRSPPNCPLAEPRHAQEMVPAIVVLGACKWNSRCNAVAICSCSLFSGSSLSSRAKGPGDFLRHSGHHRVQHFVLVLGKRPSLLVEGIQFLPANFIPLLAQRNDRPNHPLRQQLSTEALRLGLPNLLCLGRGSFALPGIVVDQAKSL